MPGKQRHCLRRTGKVITAEMMFPAIGGQAEAEPSVPERLQILQ